jgi:hypothetical protein
MTFRLSGIGTTPTFHHIDHDKTDAKKDIPHYSVEVNFQHPHKNDGIEVKRQAVLSNLRDIRDHLIWLRMNNWSTSDMEAIFDHMLLPLATKAERQRNPNNQVISTMNGFENIQKYLDTPKTTLITNVPGQNHFVAVDIRNYDNKSSVLVLDSVHAGYYDRADLESITRNMPPSTKVSIICMETQNSSYGCRIFSLSAASKISKSEDYMNALHNAHLSSQNDSLGQILHSRKFQRRGKVDVYQHPGSIPASFLKHAQSRRCLRSEYPQQKEELVNKKGQTLSERQEDKLVRRGKLSIAEDFKWQTNGYIFSASIEDKRLKYIDNCISYMDNADAKTVEKMTDIFAAIVEESGMPSQVGPQLDQRSLGPYDEMQSRADELNEDMLFHTAPSSPER